MNLEGRYLEDYHVESGWGVYWKWHKGGQSWGISELNQLSDYSLLKWSIIIIVITIGIMVTLDIFGHHVWKVAPRKAFKCVLPNICDKMPKAVVLTWLLITIRLHANKMKIVCWPMWSNCCSVPWEVNTMTPRWHRVWADGQLRLRLVRCNVGPFVVPRCAHANPQTVHCTYLCICKIFTTAQMRWPP